MKKDRKELRLDKKVIAFSNRSTIKGGEGKEPLPYEASVKRKTHDFWVARKV